MEDDMKLVGELCVMKRLLVEKQKGQRISWGT
jgi:hypothetical protein